MLNLSFQKYFNSIKVRLEPNDLLGTAIAVLFQFHKGTIRTEEFSRKFASLFGFQFHKGTIRTVLLASAT